MLVPSIIGKTYLREVSSLFFIVSIFLWNLLNTIYTCILNVYKNTKDQVLELKRHRRQNTCWTNWTTSCVLFLFSNSSSSSLFTILPMPQSLTLKWLKKNRKLVSFSYYRHCFVNDTLGPWIVQLAESAWLIIIILMKWWLFQFCVKCNCSSASLVIASNMSTVYSQCRVESFRRTKGCSNS